MCLACWLCLECGGTRQCRGRGGSSGGSRDRWDHAGADGARTFGCNLTVRWLRLPQLQENTLSLLTCPPRALGTTALGEEEERTGFQGHWAIHNPLRSCQTPGFVPSLGSHSHDPLQSRALFQFHLFIWQRWWVQSIPNECLKSLLSSPLSLQRLQEVRRNLDSASTVMVSDSTLRKSQEVSLGPGVAVNR